MSTGENWQVRRLSAHPYSTALGPGGAICFNGTTLRPPAKPPGPAAGRDARRGGRRPELRLRLRQGIRVRDAGSGRGGFLQPLRDCYFAGALTSSLLEHLLEVDGGAAEGQSRRRLGFFECAEKMDDENVEKFCGGEENLSSASV